MSDDKLKKHKPKPDNPRGLRDVWGDYLEKRLRAIQSLSVVYEQYGFRQLETPILEYADSLGKFLPDIDRPAGGIFGFRDDDEQWLAMRYDLTAPLARFVAKNIQSLPSPYKRYQFGSVFRNEKPGPGRFREFMQFDADSVNTSHIVADTELCLMLSQGLIELGLQETDIKININNRKLLSAILELSGLSGDSAEITNQREITLRAIDKLDRLGQDGVRLLLGQGRKDESGDYTHGAKLGNDQIDMILSFTNAAQSTNEKTLEVLSDLVKSSEIGRDGVAELSKMMDMISGLNVPNHFIIQPSTVRGLGYYTGPVFEAELTFGVPNEKGQIVQFGSVAGGGRYDELVERFIGQKVPAVGMSIGLDRLLSALESKNLIQSTQTTSKTVLVTVMDGDNISDYMRLARQIRTHGLIADLYSGSSGMKAQLKYADKRNIPVAIIQGSDERANHQLIVKDLKYRERYGDTPPENIPQQIACSVDDYISVVEKMLQRDTSN